MYNKPKKSLGQNFLIDKNIQRKISEAAGFCASDIVLEIGAGRGEITKLIAPLTAKVYAVELDTSLIGILKNNLALSMNVEVLRADILKFDFEEFFKEKAVSKIKVVGNIPYYITTPIIERLFEYRDKIKSIYLTVQKEFAQRMIAKPGSKDFGSFSCFVQYYALVRKLFLIKKTSFNPQPKVDSCFLSFYIREKPAVEARDETLFFKIIRAAFNQRRKTLKNSLENVIPRQKLENFFATYGIDANTRPEALSLEDFARLANT